MVKKKLNKRGYFFSLDAFIALLIILGVVLFIKPPLSQTTEEVSLQEDILSVMSSVKIGEVDNSYVQSLIASGKITNFNQSVLEQIGEFYAVSDPEAENLANAIFSDLNLDDSIGLYFNGQLISASNDSDFESSNRVWTSRQIISGIQAGESATGFSSRAFLTSESRVRYFYFGGYVGDGNITIDLGNNVVFTTVEAVFGDDFDLYVNDIFIGSHSPPLNTPYKFTIDSVFFSSGDNKVEFKSNPSTAAGVSIAGGFIKATYDESEVLLSEKQKNFQGIDGFVNIYDSFFVPGTLEDMEIFLHYNSTFDIFLTVGNTTVYEGNSSGQDLSVTLSDTTLQSLLDYDKISNETVPLRLGLSDVFLFGNLTNFFDIFSVTDLSASMNQQISGSENKIIDLVKLANQEFIAIILNGSIVETDNRIGLVGYNHHQRFYEDDYYHSLSVNEASLDNKVDSWFTSSGTCICCGINKAINGFLSESYPNRTKVMVVLSDGGANGKCIEQNTGDATQDAILAACTAHDEHNISVYSIGFGDNVDEEALQSIASCGNGNYYFGQIEDLVDIYKQAAQDIVRAVYQQQTVIGSGIFSRLFPDSYVFVDYNVTIPFGLLITAESEEFGNNISQGSFNVPNDTKVHEVSAISYSGSRWTNDVEIFNNSTGLWESVFNLSTYGVDYVEIGDPFAVNIPSNKVVYGDNLVRVDTGLNPINSTGGSPFNKVIYSLIKNSTGFSPILSSAQGCIWAVQFEDGSNLTMNIPSSYNGTAVCDFQSGSYNVNDAINVAVFNLLSELDLDKDGLIETKFTEQDLGVDSSVVTGIPFTWETEVQVRVWR